MNDNEEDVIKISSDDPEFKDMFETLNKIFDNDFSYRDNRSDVNESK